MFFCLIISYTIHSLYVPSPGKMSGFEGDKEKTTAVTLFGKQAQAAQHWGKKAFINLARFTMSFICSIIVKRGQIKWFHKHSLGPNCDQDTNEKNIGQATTNSAIWGKVCSHEININCEILVNVGQITGRHFYCIWEKSQERTKRKQKTQVIK